MVPSSGSSSVGRASAFQAEGRGSESRLPLHCRRRRAKAEPAIGNFKLKSIDWRKPLKLPGEVVFGASYCRAQGIWLRVAGELEARKSGPRGSVVEHFLGKEGVTGSIPVVGSITFS